jgi:hypothetical protein
VTMVQIEALEKLASTGLLKHEPPGRDEILGLLRTGMARLEDARRTINAPESRRTPSASTRQPGGCSIAVTASEMQPNTEVSHPSTRSSLQVSSMLRTTFTRGFVRLLNREASRNGDEKDLNDPAG